MKGWRILKQTYPEILPTFEMDGELKTYRSNIDQNRELASESEIMTILDFVFFKNNNL